MVLVRTLSRKEIWSAQKAWREAFAFRLHRETGRWTTGGADRHVFNRKYMCRFLTGASAEDSYRSASGRWIYVIDDSGEQGEMYDCQDQLKPSLEEYVERRGVIIFPEDHDWTAAAGPDYFDRVCFAYRDWVDNARP